MDTQSKKFEYSADMIAVLEDGRIVVIERLHNVKGLAFPGGKQDLGETLTETAIREFREETGLEFTPDYVLGTWAEPGRDPRGNTASTFFVGTAKGTVRAEAGKTRVLLFSREELQARKAEFVFDHGDVVAAYLSR